MFLIYILIVLFLLLIGHQLFSNGSSGSSKMIEGLENETTTTTSNGDYQPYNVNDPNNALILAQQNAGNIQVLKGRIDNLDGLKEKTDKMQSDINSLQGQVDALVQQQAEFGQELAGTTPPEISGTEEETTTDVEQSIQSQ